MKLAFSKFTTDYYFRIENSYFFKKKTFAYEWCISGKG